MARKPKSNSPARNGDSGAERAAEPAWQQENQSMQTDAPMRWFSAHEYTTSEDTLRTPKAEEKPGIGAPRARQEPGAAPDESETPPRERSSRPRAPQPSHERPSHTRRRARAGSIRDATPRSRRSRKAR